VPAELLDLFLELVAIPSPPGREREVANRVGAYLDELGLDWDEDGCGPTIGSDTGNVLCRLPGRGADGVPIFLCAHLDTVPPTAAIEPAVEDGIVRNIGGTILGADNKAAVAVMLDAARRIVEGGVEHGGVELLFTPMEEVGLLGAKAFDETRLHADIGFVYDQAAPIGEVIMGAPAQRSIRARFRGRAAHAGMYPEEGRSAIAAAARAVSDFRLGRIDAESTTNVGTIHGGVARNIVPETCELEAEARSRNARTLTELVQEMLDAIAFAATVSDCSVETDVEETYDGYALSPDDLAVQIAFAGLRHAGVEPTTAFSGGGADANVFNVRGRPCVNLANGMSDIHTPDERIAVDDLERMVAVTLGLVEGARGAVRCR
jgi:tripeptide aminopeptidase